MNNKVCFGVIALTGMVLALVAVAFAGESYVSRSVQVQDWYIGPQPSVADLEEMRSKGVSLVISTRRPAEMEKLDFDQSQEINTLGMRHINIPVGGDKYPFVPSMLETFTQAIDSNNGPILMHCRSGYRVSVLAAAYLVKEQGLAIDDAIEMLGNQRVKAETVELLLAH